MLKFLTNKEIKLMFKIKIIFALIIEIIINIPYFIVKGLYLLFEKLYDKIEMKCISKKLLEQLKIEIKKIK